MGLKRDILIFLSDQHSPLYNKSRGGIVDTPNLDRIQAEGTNFEEAYTTCPLCVPARMSMLSGLMPSATGILTNNDTLPDLTPTFLHCLVENGYETVLIGRMHFVGRDQRHGFTKRLAGDITTMGWKKDREMLLKERGAYHNCFGAATCTNQTGGGNSPVQEYDQMVIQEAVQYLSQAHEKPQCIVVGTYAPHFPYAAPTALYEKYKKKVTLPVFFEHQPDYPLSPILKERQKAVTDETALEAVAAYCGLIEFEDGLIGKVYDAFQNYQKQHHREGYFFYLSDHGDQAGQRRIYGKNTFFETSSKVPFFVTGPDIPKNRIITAPMSLLDLAPTVCGLTGSEKLEEWEGIDQSPVLYGGSPDPGRTVRSELIVEHEGQYHFATMIRWKDYKLVSYHGMESYDLLFDLKSDPKESKNRIGLVPEARKMKEYLPTPDAASRIEHRQQIHDRNARLFRAYEKLVPMDETEHWGQTSPSAKLEPEIH